MPGKLRLLAFPSLSEAEAGAGRQLAAEGHGPGWLDASPSPSGQDAVGGGHAPHPVLVALGDIALGAGFSAGAVGSLSPFPSFPPCLRRIAEALGAGLGDTPVTVSRQPRLAVLPQSIGHSLLPVWLAVPGPGTCPALPACWHPVGGCGGPDRGLSRLCVMLGLLQQLGSIPKSQTQPQRGEPVPGPQGDTNGGLRPLRGKSRCIQPSRLGLGMGTPLRCAPKPLGQEGMC